MVVEISKSGGIELNPGCRDDRAGGLYMDGWDRKCTSKARIQYEGERNALRGKPAEVVREEHVPPWIRHSQSIFWKCIPSRGLSVRPPHCHRPFP